MVCLSVWWGGITLWCQLASTLLQKAEIAKKKMFKVIALKGRWVGHYFIFRYATVYVRGHNMYFSVGYCKLRGAVKTFSSSFFVISSKDFSSSMHCKSAGNVLLCWYKNPMNHPNTAFIFRPFTHKDLMYKPYFSRL